MIRIITRGLLAHRRRLAVTALAIILGVSLIAGTLVLTDTISQTFGGLFGIRRGSNADFSRGASSGST